MDSILKWSGLVALVIALVLLVSPGKAHTAVFGSTACSDTTCLTGGLRILTGVLESDAGFQAGASGSSVNNMAFANCALIGSKSIAATSSAAFDCVVPSALAGDTVVWGTSTTSAIAGYQIVGGSASTTAGFDTFYLENDTGAANTPPAGVLASVPYLNLR